MRVSAVRSAFKAAVMVKARRNNLLRKFCNKFDNLKKSEHKDSFSWLSCASFCRQKGDTSPRVVVSLALLDFSLPKSLVDCLVDDKSTTRSRSGGPASPFLFQYLLESCRVGRKLSRLAALMGNVHGRFCAFLHAFSPALVPRHPCPFT